MGEILVSTRSAVPAPAPATSAEAQWKLAQAMSKAGDMLPRSYRNNPGALMLLQQWSTARGIDPLTAIQTVAFIDGKPVIDATMQRAMAKRAGYRVKVVRADATSATVEVSEDGEVIGEASYSMDDANTAGLAGKQNWRKNPVDMLVARATTRALRWHAPDAMLGVYSEDEAEQFDPVVQLEPEIASGGEGPTSGAADPAPEVPDVVDAEIVEPWEITDATLRDKAKEAGITQREIVDHASAVSVSTGGEPVRSLKDIADRADLHPDVRSHINALVTAKTESDAQREADELAFSERPF